MPLCPLHLIAGLPLLCHGSPACEDFQVWPSLLQTQQLLVTDQVHSQSLVHQRSSDETGSENQWSVPHAIMLSNVTLFPAKVKDMKPGEGRPTQGRINWSFFTSAPLTDWLILLFVCIGLFLLDYFVIQRFASSFKMHLVILAFWVLAAAAYGVLTVYRFGKVQGYEWLTGYLLEWLLSLDNLFVFHLVFETYQTPPAQTHKAVMIGIMGAVIIRMVFFLVVFELLHYFYWIRYPFGALLIWSGIQAAMSGADEDEDVKDTYIVRGCRYVLGERLVEEYDPDQRMITWKKGQMQVTLLAMVVAILELSDVVFALDSVSAKIAQVPHQFIAFSSTCLAMFGLRSMFFIIKDLVEMFELLQYGLCLILVWIGLQLMFSRYVHLPASATCTIIAAVFIVFTVGSVARGRMERRRSLQPCDSSIDNAPESSGAIRDVEGAHTVS